MIVYVILPNNVPFLIDK